MKINLKFEFREYENYEIFDFISAGPKNYGLKMRCRNTGETKAIVKIRGFRQTFNASKILHFDNIKQLILNKM